LRYIKQRDKYACGPIAIMNVLKWAGAKITYNSHFKHIKKISNCGISGTDYDGIVKVVKSYKKLFDVLECHFIYISDIDYYIKNRGSIILEYYYKDLESFDGYSGHYVFISGKLGKHYLVVNNYREGKALQICSRRKLKTMIKSKITFGRDARAIILFKKEK